MKIYLASRYSRNAEMRKMRDWLESIGHKVTSRWIDQHGGTAPTSATHEVLNGDPTSVACYADYDLEDLDAADAVISFTGGGGKGGRHAEFGYAVAHAKLLLVVGPREHVFHALSQVLHYPDLELFKAAAMGSKAENPLR